MEALVIERKDRLWIAGQARLVRASTDIASAVAEATDWEIDDANPLIKWIAGDFVESDKANTNKQFWTKDDLAMGEYSIKYAPLNMVHKVRQPVGFFAQTRQIPLVAEDAAADADDAPLKIQALSGMWSHVFPFEAALVDQADEAGNLFYSMECRGEKLECAGESGCGEIFDYMAVGTHCEHIRDRASVRHIINPTFRGGALIVPPVRPGWDGATASVFQDAVMDAAMAYAESTEAEFSAAAAENDGITPLVWEHLMASILSSAPAE